MKSLKGILKSKRDIWTVHKIPNNRQNDGVVFQNPVTPIPSIMAAAPEPTEVPGVQTAESITSGPNNSSVALPVELWKEIFLLATSIPGKDEFSTDGSAHNIMICDDPSTIVGPNYSELSQMIGTRFTIVLVCKFWYGIGMPILWSHLRLNLAGSSTYHNMLYNKLGAAHEFASYITRLEVTLPFGHHAEVYQDNGKIVEHLPSLKILTCPINFGLSLYNIQLDVLMLTRAFLPMDQRPPVGGSWVNTQVLSIDFGQEYSPILSGDHLHFPRLNNLSIKDTGGNMCDWISNDWDTPLLRVLSINSNYISNWENFLTKCSQKLEKLELKAKAVPGQTLHMPQLRVLYLADDDFLNIWSRRIQAPRLFWLGIFHLPWGTSHVGRKVAELIGKFNTVQSVALRGFQVSSTPGRGRYTHDDIVDWSNQGIELDIQLPQ